MSRATMRDLAPESLHELRVAAAFLTVRSYLAPHAGQMIS